MALSIENALISVWIVGEEILIHGLQCPSFECDRSCSLVELFKGGIDLGHVTSEVHRIQLQSEFSLSEWYDRAGVAGILVIVQKGRESIGVLIVVEEVYGLFEDLSSLVLAPGYRSGVSHTGIRVTLV